MSESDDNKLQEENVLSLRVRNLCKLYAGSAEIVGKGGVSDDKALEHEKERYENGRKKVLEIAIKLTNELYRDAALHEALNLCMRAKDMEFATAIAKAITTNLIQATILQEHGEYFVLKDGRLRPITVEPIETPLK
jgi:hypothetical protein